MGKALSIKNVLEKKYNTFQFEGQWRKIMGQPERSGFWITYGKEKNGKTFFNLKLAEYLSQFEKVLYISAEEGMAKTFQKSIKRADLDPGCRVKFDEYIPLEEIEHKMRMRNGYKIIIIDNTTIYQKELLQGKPVELLKKYGRTRLIIWISHEDRKEPDLAVAQKIKKLASVIFRVQGMTCFVSGRVPGGKLALNIEQSQLYHGTEIMN